MASASRARGKEGSFGHPQREETYSYSIPMAHHTNPPQVQGSLGSILTHYEHSQKNHNNSSNHPNNNGDNHASPVGSLTINIPAENNNTASSWHHPSNREEGDRDRSSTLGSEFDLGWALGKDGRGMSISGLLTPLGEGDEHMSEGTSTTAISGSTSSTTNSANVGAAGGTHASAGVASSGNAPLPRLPENSTSMTMAEVTKMPSRDEHIYYTTSHHHGARGIPSVGGGASQNQSNNMHDLMEQQRQSPSDDSHGSENVFLSGVFKNHDQPASSSARHSQQHYHPSNGVLIHQQQHPHQQRPNQMISHTPPTQFGTSYENSHFGKRMRAGVCFKMF